MGMKYILFVILTTCTILVNAQVETPLFRKLSEKNGLSNSRVSCFLKDKQGYLWVGTSLGLNRYDGLRFEKFMHNSYNPSSISWNVITALAEDNQGNIWIGTEAGGLNKYNPITKKFTHYRASPNNNTSITDDHILSLKLDAQNNLWIGYKFTGWSILNLATQKFIHERSGITFINGWGENAANFITDFVHDNKGHTWIISNYGIIKRNTSDGSLTIFVDRKGKYHHQNENLFTKAMLLGDTSLALTTWGCGIKIFDIYKKTFTSFLFDKQYKEGAFTNIILSITPKSDNEYWVASADRGLGIFNALTKQFKFYSHNPEDSYTPPPRECRVVYNDRDGMLWAGFDHGLCFWANSLQNFTTTTLKEPIGPTKSNTIVFASCYVPEKNAIYFSRDFGKGVYEQNQNTGAIKLHPFPAAFCDNDGTIKIGNIHAIDNKTLLLQTSTGWFTQNLLTNKIEKVKINNTLQPVGYSSTTDKNGNAWITDTEQKLYRVNLKTLTINMPKNNPTYSYPFNDYSFIAGTINEEQLWVHDKKLALCILNTTTNTIDTGYLTQGLDRIYDAKAIVQDNNQHFWITTFSSGLYEMWQNPDGKFTYKHYTESQGLPDMFLSDIVIDTTQTLWIASRSGIITYNTKTSTFKIFGIADGYNIEWSDILELNLHVTGKLLISHQQGFTSMDVYRIKKNTIPPPVHLTSFKVNSKEWIDSITINNVQHLILNYDQNFISFSFIAINFINANQNQYSYQLVGIDKNWVKAGTRREVTYADLKPGTYTFQVKAANNDGIWNEQPVLISFTIKAPFWQQAWFIVLMILFIAFIVYRVYIYRIGIIRKEERLKADFSKRVAEIELKALRAQMNPHFIFNCLNSINRYIIKSDKATASNYLTRFAKLIRLILDHSATETTSLQNELELLNLYIEMEQLRFEQRFDSLINIDANLNPNNIEIPTMLIQPYIENAIWHGLLHKEEKGKLLIEFRLFNKNIIEVIIEDNGIGRKKAAELKSKEVLKEKSYGMTISGDRLKIVNQLYNQQASCDVEDLFDEYNRPCGTRVTLKLPFIEITT